MKRYYDVTIRLKKSRRTTSFLADSFSIDEEGRLTIKSKEYGNVNVQMVPKEELVVETMDVEEEE